MHLFYYCLIVERIWNQLKFIPSSLNFLISTPQSTTFGFWDLDMNEHLSLKMYNYIYNARTAAYLNIIHLLIFFKGIKDTKKILHENVAKRRKKLSKKCFNKLIEVN